MMTKKRNSFLKTFLIFLLSTFLIALGCLCYYAAAWYSETYGSIGFDSILYTLTSDLGGVDTNLIDSFLRYIVKYIPAWTMCIAALFFSCKRKIVCRLFHKIEFRLYPVKRTTALLLSFTICLVLVGRAAVITDFTTFLANQGRPSTLYEEAYCDPDAVSIQFPEQKRNLIYIFLESMETTFFSEEEGGALSYNVIPELHQLARENLNFSHNDQIGGFSVAPGTTWTIGAMVGQTAGIPLKIPLGVNENSYGADGVFLPGVTGITDILHDNGYNQATVYGSDASFGGRLQYYTSHGVDRTYDLATAQSDGIVPEGYNNGFWGMEDLYLFEYARQIVTELAAEDSPFALTLLTVDTHHVSGFLCRLCESTYSEQYENVYRCSSRQAASFVSWLQQQDFYGNTTVVLVGDHPSMDGGYISRNVPGRYDRKVYNCILNAAAEAGSTRNRAFSTFDMFPTTLAAMGCTIEGDRLGLGTNLFSDTPTLMEEMGRDAFEEAVSRFSEYYENTFF